jgi:hypothetical protein
MSAERHLLQVLWLITAVLLAACSATPGGDDDDSSVTPEFGIDPEFSHPSRYLFREFDRASDAELAFVLRRLEASVNSAVDFAGGELIDRSPAVDPLEAMDLEALDHPEVDVSDCLSVAMASRSRHAIDRHASGVLQTDQSPGDPSAPSHHDRVFSGGTELCWGDRSCAALRAEDELTRSSALLSITLTDRVDYRWVDLGLPSPSAVEVGQEALNDGEPRWAVFSHSWMPERAAEGDVALEQAYSLGVWITRADSPELPLLRYTASWTETTLGVFLGDSTVRQLTRGGMQDAYDAQETWLETLP